MKKVLLICYSFPPNPGIGGRRWAKFSKYLAEDNVLVHVVSNFNKSKNISEWSEDVTSKNIIKHTQNVFYPEVYASSPKTIIEKLEYRFWLFFFKLFSKGALYDRSFFWRKTILNNVKAIIKKNDIKNVIVTGPPFRLMYYTSILKNELKDLNLILDFRDPWTDNSSFLGFDTLSKARIHHEKIMESKAILSANFVVSANQYLTNIFIKRYPEVNANFTTIINGFDSSDFALEQITKKKNIDTINFVMAGTLYPNVEYIVIPFLNYLYNLKLKNIELYNKMNFDFYGQIDGNINKLISNSMNSNLHLHGFKSINVVKEKMQLADFCFMFIAPNHASNFNTKFYEYLVLRKPIVLFSNDGEISDFILKNKLGTLIKPESFDKDFDEFLNQVMQNKFVFNDNFDISEFDIKFLSNKVKELLI